MTRDWLILFFQCQLPFWKKDSFANSKSLRSFTFGLPSKLSWIEILSAECFSKCKNCFLRVPVSPTLPRAKWSFFFGWRKWIISVSVYLLMWMSIQLTEQQHVVEILEFEKVDTQPEAYRWLLDSSKTLSFSQQLKELPAGNNPSGIWSISSYLQACSPECLSRNSCFH
jgi:hypothetical protein